MDEAQTNIPENKKTNTEGIEDRINATDRSIKESTAKNQAGIDPADPALKNEAAKDEIKLADILKPSTLITALVAFVLFISVGWYLYVLKPALMDNESMIHFIDSNHSKDTEAIEESSNSAINQNAAENSPQKMVSGSGDNAAAGSLSAEGQNSNVDNKSTNSSKHKTHKNAHRHKSREAQWSNNKPKCTQAQMALHQCN
ncbi:MAG TPA: hypothetical protein VK949_04170 [Methylotenera sp.]|nr:hypothetical protein [Methylotenera sp.]